MTSIFGRSKASKDPKEQVNSWSSKLRSESRQLDRQIHAIQREQQKTVQMIKETVKKPGNNTQSLALLAKEIVRSRKSIARLYSAKAEINSIIMVMKNQMSINKLVGGIEKSTQIMKSVAILNKLPETMATMRDMSKEMMKTGIIEEMMEDTLETLDQNLGLEDANEEIQNEIDNVLYEVTQGQIGKAAQLVKEEPGTGIKIPKKASALASSSNSTQNIKMSTHPKLNNQPDTNLNEDEEAMNEEEVRNMRERLQALRN